MSSGSISGEAIGVALTASRLGIAEHMARRIARHKPIASSMAVFVASDIMDGAILRKHDMDTPIRRVADGIVDNLSVGRVMIEITRNNPAARPYIGVLAVRAAFVGGLNALHLAETGEVTKGSSKQKLTNLGMAAFGIAAASGNKPLTHITGLLASAIAISTAPSHLQDIGRHHEGEYREL